MRTSVFAVAPLLFAGQLLAQTATHTPAQTTGPATHSPGAAAEPGQPPMPAHPLTVMQAHEIMQLTGTADIKERLIANIMAYFQQRLPPFVPEDVRTDLQTSLEKMDIDTPTVAIYQRYISTEDANQIIAFYKTPAGKRLLDATPPMMGQIQQTALKNGQDTSRAVLERHRAEMEAAQKTYEQQHNLGQPPTLGPTAPGTPKPATPPQP